MQNKNSCKGGFTLIELLVVVLIIGILAGIALPQYQRAVKKSRLAELTAMVDAGKKNLELYVLSNEETVVLSGVEGRGSLSFDLPWKCDDEGWCETKAGKVRVGYNGSANPEMWIRCSLGEWLGSVRFDVFKAAGEKVWNVIKMEGEGTENLQIACQWIKDSGYPAGNDGEHTLKMCKENGVILKVL